MWYKPGITGSNKQSSHVRRSMFALEVEKLTHVDVDVESDWRQDAAHAAWRLGTEALPEACPVRERASSNTNLTRTPSFSGTLSFLNTTTYLAAYCRPTREASHSICKLHNHETARSRLRRGPLQWRESPRCPGPLRAAGPLYRPFRLLSVFRISRPSHPPLHLRPCHFTTLRQRQGLGRRGLPDMDYRMSWGGPHLRNEPFGWVSPAAEHVSA
jgi:hypothetical protein